MWKLVSSSQLLSSSRSVSHKGQYWEWTHPVLTPYDQVTTMPAALAAGSTSNHLQVGSTGIQGPDQIDASASELSHQATWHRVDRGLYALPRLIDFLNNSLVQHLLTVQCAIPCSGPATCSNSLETLKSTLKSFLFSQYNWYTLPAASASEYNLMALYKSITVLKLL